MHSWFPYFTASPVLFSCTIVLRLDSAKATPDLLGSSWDTEVWERKNDCNLQSQRSSLGMLSAHHFAPCLSITGLLFDLELCFSVTFYVCNCIRLLVVPWLAFAWSVLLVHLNQKSVFWSVATFSYMQHVLMIITFVSWEACLHYLQHSLIEYVLRSSGEGLFA